MSGPAQKNGNGKKNDVRKENGNGVKSNAPLQEGPMQNEKPQVDPGECDPHIKEWKLHLKFYNECAIDEAEGNELEGLKYSIAQGADINYTDGAGDTPLIMAAREGNLEIAEYLISKGADVNAANMDGETALMKAALWGHLEVVRTLIRNGADIEAKDKNGANVLTYAAAIAADDEYVKKQSETIAVVNPKENHIQIAELLLKEGVSVDPKALIMIGVMARQEAYDDFGIFYLSRLHEKE